MRLNLKSEYRAEGIKTAKAVRNRDMACAKFHNDWLTRALALEPEDYRHDAREAWMAGYREESGLHEK